MSSCFLVDQDNSIKEPCRSTATDSHSNCKCQFDVEETKHPQMYLQEDRRKSPTDLSLRLVEGLTVI